MELEELKLELKEMEPEAPQCAQLHGVGPRVESQQLAGPCLVPEAEDERHEAWPATDRQ